MPNNQLQRALFTKGRELNRGRAMKYWGLGIALFSIMGMGVYGFSGMTHDNGTNYTMAERMSGVIIYAVLFLVGVLLFFVGRHRKKTGDRYRGYLQYLIGRSSADLKEMALQAGVPYESLLKDLQYMMLHAYLGSARIDYEAHVLYLGDAGPVELVTVTCPSCGAGNEIPAGGTASCAYCKKKISAKENPARE